MVEWYPSLKARKEKVVAPKAGDATPEMLAALEAEALDNGDDADTPDPTKDL